MQITNASIKTLSHQSQGHFRQFFSMYPLLAVLGGTLVIYVLLLAPSKFGEYHDDGIYVTTAKALATGQGYRIISLPFDPAQTKYPPFYPWLLSAVWRLYPVFPQNIIWMMLVSVAATLTFLGLTYYYLIAEGYAARWQALVLIALTAANWRTLTVATGIYSEMVYAALSVAGLILAEKYLKQNQSWAIGISLGVILGLAFLTRTSAISLIAAVACSFILSRRLTRALFPLGIACLFILGWIAWCAANKTNVDAVNVAYYTNYVAYFRQVISDLAANNGTSILTTIINMLGRNTLSLIVISVPVVSLGIPYEWILYFGFSLLFFVSGFYRQIKKGFRLVYLYVTCYLILHIFWLPYVSYDRFLIPLLPFFLLILITEITALASSLRQQFSPSQDWVNKISIIFIAVALMVAISVTLYSYGSDLFSSLAGSSWQFGKHPLPRDAEAIDWINNNTDSSEPLIAYCDPLYFLYTGHKTTRSAVMRSGITWRTHQMLIFKIIKEANAKYLVYTSNDFENEFQPEIQRQSFKTLLDEHTERFVPVFESKNGRSIVYAINGSE